MSLASGTRLGPYEVLGLIGAGGMGEVYKANDTRLGRTVAIKVLPPHLTDLEHRARFEREARTIAGLSHPHICSLYDVGEHGSSLFLVMEHLEGGTLAERLRKGALPLPEALEIGAQTAEALSAAHRAGFIHRDLKPGNIMLTKTGVKLLDFGLAKLKAPLAQPAFESAVSLPTQSEPLTGRGMILGTLQYMAPEQLEGKEADARTDIWALGLVLYEMVTGRRAFGGNSSASVITAIMSSEPAPVSAVRPLSPPTLERILRTCLAKNPDERWQNAKDLAAELGWIQADSSTTATVRSRWWSRPSTTALLVAAGAVSGALVAWELLPRVPAASRSHLSVSTAASVLTLTDGGVAVSPDGRAIVFGARGPEDEQRLYVRRLDEWESRPLKGTEGATTPFFSPDGVWLAFVANGLLKKTQLGEGTPQTICRIQYQGTSRGDWGPDDRIIVSHWPGSLLRVAAEGGEPRSLVPISPALRYLWPQMLPDGKTVIFTLVEKGHSRIAALATSTGSVRTVIDSASCGRYLPTGHLVYESEGHLRAVRFDPERLEPLGPSRVVIDDIAIGEVRSTIAFGYDVSASGTMVYVPASTSKSVLVWKDRTGRTIPSGFNPRQYAFPSLSADGRRLTVTVSQWPTTSVWVGSVGREPLTQLTSAGSSMCSLFSHDGKWVVFTSPLNGWFNLFRARSDGSGPAERLLDARAHQKPTSFSPIGTMLLFNEATDTDRDIMQADVSRPGFKAPFVKTPANELEAAISPDGKWVAYQSDESGQWEIYLRPASGAGSRQRISVEGGLGPLWNPRGAELFYQTRTALMSVRIADGVVSGVPTKLFSCRRSEDYRREFDVTPDGEHFLFMEPATSRTEINVITNWFEELKAKVPVGK